jgi:mono/diheme cytochrome c family protein
MSVAKSSFQENHRPFLGVVVLCFIIIFAGVACSLCSCSRTSSPPQPGRALSAQGASIFASHCSGCHGPDGEGIPGAFPPLKGDPVVNDRNPIPHIRTVLFGLQGKTINGIMYTGAMPAWADQLSDEEVAAVINHERTSWGNNAPTITAEEVARIRRNGEKE